MKLIYLFSLILLLSCTSPRDMQVYRREGTITKIESIAREGEYIKRVEWTTDNRIIFYEYVPDECIRVLGQQEYFYLKK